MIHPSKSVITHLAHYNRRANVERYDAMAKLADGARKRAETTWFGSIHGLLNHLLVGDMIWLQRFRPVFPESIVLSDPVLSPPGLSWQQPFSDELADLRRQRVFVDDRAVAWFEECPQERIAAADDQFVLWGTAAIPACARDLPRRSLCLAAVGPSAPKKGAKMRFLRSHWYDVGIGLAGVTGAALVVFPVHGLSLLLWVSLISLLLHQAEEYRFPGTFPGMINRVMFGSSEPDRYPLNPNTALIVNVTIGWLLYLLAALFGARLLWLGLAAILVSTGNFIAHTFVFNIRGRTGYNPGMLTSILLFLPISVLFFIVVIHDHLARPADWIAGIAFGIALNYLGVLKMIDLLKDENTDQAFPARNVGGR